MTGHPAARMPRSGEFRFAFHMDAKTLNGRESSFSSSQHHTGALGCVNRAPMGATDVRRVTSRFRVTAQAPSPADTAMGASLFLQPTLVETSFLYQVTFSGSRHWDLDISGSHYSAYHNDSSKTNEGQAQADGPQPEDERHLEPSHEPRVRAPRWPTHKLSGKGV